MTRANLHTRGLAALLACIVAALALASTAAASPPDTRFAVTTARLVAAGKSRSLLLEVRGPATNVRVRVTMLGARRTVLRAVVRRIPTNRRVRVHRLAIPWTVKTVRVRVLGHVG